MADGFFARATNFLTNPLFSGIVGIAGIAGLVFAVYAYFDTKSEPQLVALVQPIRGTLVSSEAVEKLQIIYEGKLINGAVTTAQVAFWNHGRKPIRSEDILESVEIYFDPPAQIISAVVKTATRDTIDVQMAKSRFAEGVVPIKWKILEHQDGVTLQLTYVGGPEANIRIRGVVIGQKEIEIYKGRTPLTKSSASYPSKWRDILEYLWGWSFVAAVVFFLVASILTRNALNWEKSRPGKTVPSWMSNVVVGTRVISAFAVVLFFASMLAITFVGSAPSPPFAF